jgi:hypothetical protein
MLNSTPDVEAYYDVKFYDLYILTAEDGFVQRFLQNIEITSFLKAQGVK